MNKSYVLCLGVVAAVFGSASQAAASRQGSLPVLTFVLAGQSNMVGQGTIDGRTPVNPRVTVLTGTGWVTATEPLPQGVVDPPYPQRPGYGVGPGIAFANDLIAKGRASRVRLISCAVSGTSVKDWVPGGVYYKACAAQIRVADRIAGVLFYQGEADALSYSTAKAWQTRFGRFVQGMRLLTHRAPVVFAQLGPLPMRPDFRAFWNVVKAGQASTHLTGVKMIRTDDLGVMADGVHHTAAAERIVGYRFSKAWRLMVSSPLPTYHDPILAP